MALAPLLGAASVHAAPLQWQVDASPSAAPAAQAGTPPDDSTATAARRLIWTLDPTVEPATASQPPATASQLASQATPTPPASTSTTQQPAAATPVSTAPAQPQPPSNGLPAYGVPVTPAFPLPYIGGAVPTAYIGGWGNYWFGLSGGTPGKLRDGQVDASFNAGIGFGDFYNLAALEVDWGVGSIKNLGANGGFNVSLGRLLVDQPRFQLAAAGGVLSFYTYGTEGNREPASGYGVITMATPLRPGNYDFAQVMQLSLGAGGYQFGYSNPDTLETDSTGYFASLGLQITRNVGLSVGWSNRGTNVNLSYTPFRDLPIYLNVVGSDLFNTSPSGTVAVFSISWGDDFRTALF